MPLPFTIPAHLNFADLDLRRDPATLDLRYKIEVLDQLLAHNGLTWADCPDAGDDPASTLLISWYFAHRAAGGATHPIMELILAEIDAEDTHGRINLQPGGTGMQ